MGECVFAHKYILMSFWRRGREAFHLRGRLPGGCVLSPTSDQLSSGVCRALDRELHAGPSARPTRLCPGPLTTPVNGVGAGRGLVSRKGSHTGGDWGPPAPPRLSSQPICPAGVKAHSPCGAERGPTARPYLGRGRHSARDLLTFTIVRRRPAGGAAGEGGPTLGVCVSSRGEGDVVSAEKKSGPRAWKLPHRLAGPGQGSRRW